MKFFYNLRASSSQEASTIILQSVFMDFNKLSLRKIKLTSEEEAKQDKLRI